jgi:choline transporter-like protein 2/4/5
LTGLVWFSIFTVISLVAGVGYFAQSTAQAWEAEDPPTVRPNQIDYTTYTAYALYGIAGLLLLIACCLRSQIQLAIGCVKEAGKAINSMVLILFVPFLQGISFMVFWLVWGYFAVHLASLGSISTQSYPVDFQGTEVTIRVYEFDDFIEQCGWYLLFCFFWTASFIVAVGDMIVAMAVSKWYFTVDKSTVTSLTVLNSLVTTLLYHLGTCAYGSLIIAIIKLLRAILAKIQKQVAKATNQTIANTLLCCCQCCMCCLEKCMKFINKNAYIQCAIFGTPFCHSARKAFYLILRNAARIGAVSYISAAVLVVGKLFISTLTTAASYFTIVEYLEIDLYSYAGPVVLIFIVSYFVADMFMAVFEIGILAILHCFVADEEMFGGQPRYAEGGLTSWVDKNGGIEARQ